MVLITSTRSIGAELATFLNAEYEGFKQLHLKNPTFVCMLHSYILLQPTPKLLSQRQEIGKCKGF